MNIFFLAPRYLNLYKPIQDELERQGHTVVFFEDRVISAIKWVYSRKRRLLAGSCNPYVVYWRRMFYANQRVLFDQKYDLLFCINGVSFHPILLRKLKRMNRKLRSSFYVWDTSKYFDYFRYYKHFDRVFTFDIDDSGKFHVFFLPFYWIPVENKKEICEREDYMLSIVGSDHDGRLEIVKKIARQLEGNNLSYCFKLYEAPETSPFFIREPLPFDETLDIMMRSRCILDTDRPTQTGTTPRVIWALALGKKIISTNTNLARMFFYDKKYIWLIDRNNPTVDLDFIKNDVDVPNSESNALIGELRIDKWVKNFLPLEYSGNC